MQKSRHAGKEGCSKGGIQDWKDSGPEVYIKGGIQNLRIQERRVQDRRDEEQ